MQPNSLIWRLHIALRRSHLSLIKKIQSKKKWAEDSISCRFNVSWKLWLNLFSLKWLSPSLSLVISLIPLGLWQSKKIWRRSFENNYFSLKDWNTLRVSKIGVSLIPFSKADGKKSFLKLMLCLNKGNNAHSFCSMWCTSYGNETKIVLPMLIFENCVKETKFSPSMTKLKGALGQILGRFFLLTNLK